MKKIHVKQEKFMEFELNPEMMNKIRGGDSPIDPTEPPAVLPPK